MATNYAFISLTTAPQTMANGEKIPFNLTSTLKGMTYSSTNRQLTVSNDGLYQISFGYHHNRSHQFTIYVNGTSLGAPYITNGETIVSVRTLNKNDTVSMVKTDASDTTNTMTAFLNLHRLR